MLTLNFSYSLDFYFGYVVKYFCNTKGLSILEQLIICYYAHFSIATLNCVFSMFSYVFSVVLTDFKTSGDVFFPAFLVLASSFMISVRAASLSFLKFFS